MGEQTKGSSSWLPPFMDRLRSRYSTPKQEGGGGGEEEPNERSRLLPDSSSTTKDAISIVTLPEEKEELWHQLWRTEAKILITGAIPVILSYTLQMSLQTVSVLIVGRTSPENLATAAFSYMFAMVTGWMIAIGGTTAVDTLGSATFTGSKDKTDLGVILQRSFVVLSLFYIPVLVVWFFAEPIFLALGQSPQISHDSARFLWCLTPGAIGYIYFEATKKFLQAQGNDFSPLSTP